MTERSSERGIALVLVLFMILVLSVLGASLVFVSRTETMSSINYRTMSQTRYAAESGVHSAINYILWNYTAPVGTAALGSYDMLQSPVTYNGSKVFLSSRLGESSNYPTSSIVAAFKAASRGWLTTSYSSVLYDARATLLSMRSFTDALSGSETTIQTWEIVGRGTVPGAASAQVEVATILERQDVPLYKYAAFAVSDQCSALSLHGGATTDSYDSRNALVSGSPVRANHTGHVGTNGGLSGNGAKTDVHGTLSTPRNGVGACSTGNVTATTGGVTVDAGLVHLPQAIAYPTPPAISPAPPTTSWAPASCATTSYCTAVGSSARFAPPSGTTVQLGNVSVGNGKTLYLNAGTYEINSIDVKGDVVVESGPVILKVSGAGTGTPVDFTAGSISNTSYVAANMQIIYGGTGEIKLRGNAAFAAVVYAPQANADFAGNGDFYGALVTKTISATGGSSIHYDRALQASGFTLGNPVLNSFTWKSY